MAEKMCPGPLSTSAGFREAVCVHTKKFMTSAVAAIVCGPARIPSRG